MKKIQVLLIMLVLVLLAGLSGTAQAKGLDTQINSFAKNAESMVLEWEQVEGWMKANRSEYKGQALMVEILKSDTRLVITLQVQLLDKFSNAALFAHNKEYNFFVSEGIRFAENDFPITQELAELHFKLLAKNLKNDELVHYCLTMSEKIKESHRLAQEVSETLKANENSKG
jgi:hypothetical protein